MSFKIGNKEFSFHSSFKSPKDPDTKERRENGRSFAFGGLLPIKRTQINQPVPTTEGGRLPDRVPLHKLTAAQANDDLVERIGHFTTDEEALTAIGKRGKALSIANFNTRFQRDPLDAIWRRMPQLPNAKQEVLTKWLKVVDSWPPNMSGPYIQQLATGCTADHALLLSQPRGTIEAPSVIRKTLDRGDTVPTRALFTSTLQFGLQRRTEVLDNLGNDIYGSSVTGERALREIAHQISSPVEADAFARLLLISSRLGSKNPLYRRHLSDESIGEITIAAWQRINSQGLPQNAELAPLRLFSDHVLDLLRGRGGYFRKLENQLDDQIVRATAAT
jgi:hypothetical protein